MLCVIRCHLLGVPTSRIYLEFGNADAFFEVARQEFSEAADTNTQKGLQIAVVLGLVLVAGLFSIADELRGLSLPLVQLWSGAFVVFLLGFFVWKVKEAKHYGQFAYVTLLTAGIGFTWFARISGTEQIELIAACFVTGSLLHFGLAFMKHGAQERA